MLISEYSLGMTWKPNKWIALLLGLILQPFSMLYLARPRWALFYLLLSLIVGGTECWLLMTGKAPWLNYMSVGWLIMVGCAIHSYRLASVGTFPLPRRWYSHWYGMVAILVLPLLGIGLVRSFFYEPFRIPSSSMAPALPLGSYVIASKSGMGDYGTFGITVMKTAMTAKIDRGDIIVFRYPPDPKLDYVKRVIGLPGDVISYKSKNIFINGIKVQAAEQTVNGEQHVMEERYGNKSWQTIINSSSAAIDYENVVPAHQYFVLGDNRDNSRDSRYWGFVPEENIFGKVAYVFK